ncbi:hypothetical protein WJT74_05400 [Sphingomicrobium sp. XHP0239]|uniref:hypothetical protein n=1 Tax=Sphingomicrobium maritimum TaxID=3133972 RepID=UPI0031CC57D4
MSIFGDSEADQRDYGFAFAALKSSMYLWDVLARSGQLSMADAIRHSELVRDGLEIVPERYLGKAGWEAVESSLKQIEEQARLNYGKDRA